MAVEQKRGCGFRKVGGLYLVADGPAAVCDRLPIPIERCPCCGEGLKFSRAWTWIDAMKLFEGDHKPLCFCPEACPACYPSIHFSDPQTYKAGLLWVGEASYPTPHDFAVEAERQGISRRIPAIPRGFKAGETWVFFAHIKACSRQASEEEGGLFVQIPGVFMAIRPRGFEKIVLQSEYETWKLIAKLKEEDRPIHDPDRLEVYRKLQNDVERGIRLIPVPDDDPDHNPNGNGNGDE